MRNPFLVFCKFLRLTNRVGPILVVLLFLGALFWAESQDPFLRQWFTLKTVDQGPLNCVAVIPKPIRQYPVIIYAHESGGSLINDGSDIRQIAEFGFVVVSLEYDQNDESKFTAEFQTIIDYVNQQRWANTNAVAWVGFRLGAIRMLNFAIQHPQEKPQLFVQLSDTSPPTGQNDGDWASSHCPVLLICYDQKRTVLKYDTNQMASILETKNVGAELKNILSITNDIEMKRGMILRRAGESCRSYLVADDAWQTYHSIARWQAEATSLWLFWLPAGVWGGFCIARWQYRNFSLPKKVGLKRLEVRLLAVVLVAWTTVETAVHLVTPHLLVDRETLYIARRFLLHRRERLGFEFFAAQHIWHGQKLQTLLDHLELATYNRELINWHVDDKIYQEFVLSPIITGTSDEQLNWRRPLWEEFYPRVRRESSPERAAQIAMQHLCERMTVANLTNSSHSVLDIWLKQVTDEEGFNIICVAVLRSVGIPARLNGNHRAEFLARAQWQEILKNSSE